MKDFVFRGVVITLAGILGVVIVTMAVGLFDPIVDNKEIFKLLEPAFNMVVGAFVGVLSAEIRRKDDK